MGLSVLTLALLVHSSWLSYSGVQTLVFPQNKKQTFLPGPCILEADSGLEDCSSKRGYCGYQDLALSPSPFYFLELSEPQGPSLCPQSPLARWGRSLLLVLPPFGAHGLKTS